MKISDYFINILMSIFAPKYNIDKENIYKSIKAHNEEIIKCQDEIIKSQDKAIKDFNISYNELYRKYNEVNREYHILKEINVVLNNKLQRYYKTGKNIKKKQTF